MATRKPIADGGDATPAPASRRSTARPASTPAAGEVPAPRRAKAAATSASRPRKATPGGKPAAKRRPAAAEPQEASPAPPVASLRPNAPPVRKRLTAAERERRFNALLQAACLKAGTAAAISTISSKVPFLGKLAPVVLGSVGEALVLAKVQQQLVREILALYQLELSDVEERGVILLATAVNIGAQQISKATVEELIEQLSGRLYRPVISRVLPLASVATEVAAAVASTYAVGKRTQALCTLPGTGAKDLGELLRSMSGIDQNRLYKWTGDAFALALKPFRGALLAVIPGLGAWTRPGR